jgi:hypothetical protein
VAGNLKKNIETKKTFVVISGEGEELAMALSFVLSDRKRQLHEKFNGSKLPSFLSMINHFGEDAKREEIFASAEAVLDNKKNFMMIISGYQPNEEWNNALEQLFKTKELSNSFISLNGDLPPEDISKQFHAISELSPDDEDALLALALNTISEARDQSTVPFEEAGFEVPKQLQRAKPTLN